jgi:protein-disulfide isomerase
MSSIQTPNTPWFAATIGLLGLVVGYAAASGIGGVLPSGAPSAPPPAIGDQPSAPAVVYDPAGIGGNEVLGEANAPVTVIEFTDYQCPFCARHYEQTFGRIKSEYVDTGKVKYVVRDFALAFHPHAQKASEATECAADQGKFWEMHSVIFRKQQEWASAADGPAAFKQYAADLGLNASTFASCLDDGVHADEVKQDMVDGQASGISGTPGFWIIGPDGKGEIISGAYPFETFAEVIDGMLN